MCFDRIVTPDSFDKSLLLSMNNLFDQADEGQDQKSAQNGSSHSIGLERRSRVVRQYRLNKEQWHSKIKTLHASMNPSPLFFWDVLSVFPQEIAKSP